MALIITLILLSVITFMAIAFLVISRSRKSSVGMTTDQTVALGAADAAMARAEAQVLAPMLAWTNPFNVGLVVSTNFINPVGFTRGSGAAYVSPTNVNYTYANGFALNPGGDALQNLANLEYDPRPPVFVTNYLQGGYDFRYYLDLNRNGAFDPSGWVGVTNDLGREVPNTGFTYQIGDPQWIGGLEFPDRPHSANNQFIYRYAYMVVPASQTLDINYIHNQAYNPAKAALDANGRYYMRNQGVGTWEINLGAFLYDLNTNIYGWGGLYGYNPPLPPPGFTPTYVSTGNAFSDAGAIVANRYAGSLTSLASVAAPLGLYANGRAAFANDGIDDYSAGPVMTTTWHPIQDPDVAPFDRLTRPWPGADNTNHLFTTQDLFDPTKTSVAFTNRLITVAAHTNTYDRYTYYRLLSQLGTDSAPAPANTINLNYDNLVQTNFQGIVSPTNFFPWRPVDFFTKTANALLTNAGYNFTVTNIEIYPTNYYTASVHRLLQLALNIYDSTTNRAFLNITRPPYCPTVLRPLFRRTTARTPTGTTNVVYVAGYREVLGTALALPNTAPPILELDNGNPNATILRSVPVMGTAPYPNERQEPLISGMPLVIGAKKGFPNFNEFSMQTYVYLSRLMEFRRANNDVNSPVTQTNLMYVLSLTNTFGLEAWNSYLTAYPRNLQLIAAVDVTPIVSSLDFGVVPLTLLSNRVTSGVVTNIPAGRWPGWQKLGQEVYSFILPWSATNGIVFTNATYVTQPPYLEPETHVFPAPRNTFYAPHWVLNLNSRIRYILVDTDAQRIIDYVNLDNWDPAVDITATLAAGADCQRRSAVPGEPLEPVVHQPCAQWPHHRHDEPDLGRPGSGRHAESDEFQHGPLLRTRRRIGHRRVPVQPDAMGSDVQQRFRQDVLPLEHLLRSLRPVSAGIRPHLAASQ